MEHQRDENQRAGKPAAFGDSVHYRRDGFGQQEALLRSYRHHCDTITTCLGASGGVQMAQLTLRHCLRPAHPTTSAPPVLVLFHGNGHGNGSITTIFDNAFRFFFTTLENLTIQATRRRARRSYSRRR